MTKMWHFHNVLQALQEWAKVKLRIIDHHLHHHRRRHFLIDEG